jgi:hypothetical protein
MEDFLRNYFVATILILLILYALVSTHVSIAKKKAAIERSVTDAIEESKKQIKASISPRVVFCASIDQVRSEAAEIILAAVSEFSAAVEENARLAKDGSLIQLDISQYFITIYGAASLINESEVDRNLDDAVKRESITRYRGARDQASQSKLRFRRYVSLLDSGELSSRSEAVRAEYIDWLQRQYQDLQNDPNYTMILSPRAPRWGSSNSTIIGNAGIIEIKGHGGSAFAIYDRRIAVDLRTSLRADIYGSLPKNRREISQGDHESMSWLKAFIDQCTVPEGDG